MGYPWNILIINALKLPKELFYKYNNEHRFIQFGDKESPGY